MKAISFIFIDIITFLMFIVSNIYSITWMLNITLFIYWVLVICLILSLFVEDEQLFKYVDDFTPFSVVLFACFILVLIGFGYFVLGSISFVCGVIYLTRKYNYFKQK
jgi:hypothetical protein